MMNVELHASENKTFELRILLLPLHGLLKYLTAVSKNNLTNVKYTLLPMICTAYK